MNFKKNGKQKFNVFFGLLRMYISFLVVNDHCFKPPISLYQNKFKLKFLKSRIHVPIFYIMSFYFCYNLFSTRNIAKIKLRFERIIIPYFIWPIIIFIINNYLLNFISKISLYDLLLQLLYGHRYLTVFWFQYDLIIVTIIFTISSLLFCEFSIFFLINLAIISFYFQYSNNNYILFSKLPYYKKYSLGRFAEIIPYCVSGYIFGYLKVSIISNKYRFFYSYFFLILLLFFVQYNVFTYIQGFYYQGLKLYSISLYIFIILLLFPSEILTNNTFITYMKFLTNHTSGIYYLHICVYNYFAKYNSLIRNKTLYGCMIIYLICYLISFLGILFFGKTKLKHLFQ